MLPPEHMQNLGHQDPKPVYSGRYCSAWQVVGGLLVHRLPMSSFSGVGGPWDFVFRACSQGWGTLGDEEGWDSMQDQEISSWAAGSPK